MISERKCLSYLDVKASRKIKNFQKMTSAEIGLLEGRCSLQDINDAKTLIRLWEALLRVNTESENIIRER